MTIRTELKDSIYVVEITDGGKFVPCIPYECNSKTTALRNGEMLKFVEVKEIGMNNDFLVLELIESGDTVLVAPSCISFFKRIPSKNRLR